MAPSIGIDLINLGALLCAVAVRSNNDKNSAAVKKKFFHNIFSLNFLTQ